MRRATAATATTIVCLWWVVTIASAQGGLNVRELYKGAVFVSKKIQRKLGNTQMAKDTKFDPRKIVEQALGQVRKDRSKVANKLIPALNLYFDVSDPEDLPEKLEEDRSFPASDRFEMLELCGDHFLSQREAYRARPFYESALKLSPSSDPVRRQLAEVRRLEGEWSGASVRRENAHRAGSESPQRCVALGRQCLGSRDYNRAVRYLETAVAGGVRESQTYTLLGDAYMGAGRSKEAEEAYAKALSAGSRDAED